LSMSVTDSCHKNCHGNANAAQATVDDAGKEGLVLVCAFKGYGGNRVIAPLILNLGLRRS